MTAQRKWYYLEASILLPDREGEGVLMTGEELFEALLDGAGLDDIRVFENRERGAV